ncbi:hypothetical protein B296_00010622 [Ensete ventricosum]|uniref:Uncharacterized protein n=1 Tax=Ensete ventricosum TaxID=4639 RepID=A0A427B8R2_ENSVE|nr:hypothetical protein B296_00010622 [Ensete ventricosum]
MLRPSVTQERVDEGELPRERTKNRRWWRPYDVGMVKVTGELDCFSTHICLREPDKSEDKAGVACLSIDQGELLGGHRGVEVGGSKGGEEATRSPEGLNYPNSKVSVRKEVDSEEHYSAAEADLSIAKEGMQIKGNG